VELVKRPRTISVRAYVRISTIPRLHCTLLTSALLLFRSCLACASASVDYYKEIMGGDGGVIASNRKYLRGAGAADHTADRQKDQNEKSSLLERMRTCHLTKAPLNFNSTQIVACPYGRLYCKEAAVEALLRRQQDDSKEVDELGSHIRGLKDLHAARFHVENGSDVPSCPVTGVELNGKHAAFLIPKKDRDEQVNVLSERALKEMGIEALQADYGPFEKKDMIRLAPPESSMEEIREAVAKKHQAEKANKKVSVFDV
jgi:hypothetical protein